MIKFTHILFILASLFINHDIALFRDIDSVQELSDIFVFDGCRLLNKSGRLADGFDGVSCKKLGKHEFESGSVNLKSIFFRVSNFQGTIFQKWDLVFTAYN